MSLRLKIVLLTIVPMLLGMLIVSLLVNHQTRQLSVQQSGAFHDALLEVYEVELTKVTQMALSALTPILNDNNLSEAEKRSAAKKMLSNLAYADDGYFFVYTSDGENLVHPKQSYRIGKNWWNLEDSEGKLIIQDLIKQAQAGGGYTEYLWEQPSSGEITKKLSYAEMIEGWNWMIGTGVYIDDIDRQVAQIETVFDNQIRATSLAVMAIAAAVVLAVVLCGLALQIGELKSADQKLLMLTKRVMNTQDEERRRVSRELHDGINQRLVAIKYSLEEARMADNKAESKSLKHITSSEQQIDETISDVRRMSRDLHPSILDDLGLMVAVDALVEQFSRRTGIDVSLTKVPFRNLLETAAKTAFYRVTQEALSNIEKHAQASKVHVAFEIQNDWFQLTVEDNGLGFDKQAKSREQTAEFGLGLRNMAERMSYFKGTFDVKSSSNGTTILAAIPRTSLKLRY